MRTPTQGHTQADDAAPGLGLTRRQALGVLVISPWLAPVALADEAPVQLATTWPPGRSPQGFLVSEKFDGVRAVWDGQVLRFRSGRVLTAPAWFASALPSNPLDGELWMGRGQFDRLSGVVRKAVPDDEAWRAVKYLVFDVPGHAAPFAERVRELQERVHELQQERERRPHERQQ